MLNSPSVYLSLLNLETQALPYLPGNPLLNLFWGYPGTRELIKLTNESLSLTLFRYGSDIAKSSFEALASLAKDYFKEKLHKGQSIHQVDVTLKHFLKVSVYFRTYLLDICASSKPERGDYFLILNAD